MVLESFKGLKAGEDYKVHRKLQYRWSGDYSYHIIILGTDIYKTPQTVIIHKEDFNKIIKI